MQLSFAQLDGDFGADFLSSMMPSLVIWAGLYVYFSITLMVLAKKTGTPNGWMAWVPLINLFLMCDVARKSYGWIFLALIPCLNIIAAVALWSGIAEARGKSAAWGILILVPGLNLLVPAILCLGPTTQPASPFTQAAPSGGQVNTCGNCNGPLEPGDEFCGSCGKGVPKVVSVAQPVAVPPPQGRLGCGTLLLAGMLLMFLSCGGGLAYFFLYTPKYTPPDRKEPHFPPLLSTTMETFPLDTEPGDPGPDGNPVPPEEHAQPRIVIIERYVPYIPPGWDERDERAFPQPPDSSSTPSDRSEFSPESLPPGLPPSDLPQFFEGSTQAEYGNQLGQRVTVTGFVPQPGVGSRDIGDRIARRASGGTITDVRTRGPGGSVIATGQRIITSTIVVYVLVHQRTGQIFVIYAPDAASIPLATRLANNVGNSRGLLDLRCRHLINVLPASQPPFLTLIRMRTVDVREMENAKQELRDAAGSDSQAQELVTQIEFIMPNQLVACLYHDQSQQEWISLVCEYESPAKATQLYRGIYLTFGWGKDGSTEVSGTSGIYFDDEQHRLLVFQKGPYLVMVGSPISAQVEDLAALGTSLQL